MGNSVWFAMLILIAVFFLNVAMSSKYRLSYKEAMKKSDKRLKKISECFINIRYVKMAALENYFLDQVCKVKQEELGIRYKVFKISCWVGMINRMSPVLFMCTLVAFNSIFGDGVDVTALFTSLNVFNKFNPTIKKAPTWALRMFDWLVSGERVNDFLLSEEVSYNGLYWEEQKKIEGGDCNGDTGEDNAVEIKNGMFYWVEPKMLDVIERKAQLDKLRKKNKGFCKKAPELPSKKSVSSKKGKKVGITKDSRNEIKHAKGEVVEDK